MGFNSGFKGLTASAMYHTLRLKISHYSFNFIFPPGFIINTLSENVKKRNSREVFGFSLIMSHKRQKHVGDNNV